MQIDWLRAGIALALATILWAGIALPRAQAMEVPDVAETAMMCEGVEPVLFVIDEYRSQVVMEINRFAGDHSVEAKSRRTVLYPLLRYLEFMEDTAHNFDRENCKIH